MTIAYEVGKRLVDVAVSSSALVLCAPVLAAVAAAVRLDSGAPVLFKQARVGRGGRPFQLLKFRTMAPGSSVLIRADGTVHNPQNDARVTRVGALLRRTSLDELPQLLNVLRGDMSLVGPRPDLPQALGMYTPEQAVRLTVKPGMTGLAQVSGRNLLDAREKWRIDAEYARVASFALDASIVARTVARVLARDGIYRG